MGSFKGLLAPVLKAAEPVLKVAEPVREALRIDANAYAQVGAALGLQQRYTYSEVCEEGGLVFDYGTSELAVDTERIQGPQLSLGVETLATYPIDLTASVPEHFTEEDIKEKTPFKIRGPHGPIEVKPPDGTVKGGKITLRLVPRPEFRIEVPPDARPGLCFNVKRGDGVEVEVSVPPHLKPGDKFEVLPPAMMVRVPDGVDPGAYVMFRRIVKVNPAAGTEVVEWCRVKVPQGVAPGQYFAARLPVPGDKPKASHPGSHMMASHVPSPPLQSSQRPSSPTQSSGFDVSKVGVSKGGVSIVGPDGLEGDRDAGA